MNTFLVFLLITHWTTTSGRSIVLEPMPSMLVCEQLATKILASETRGRHGFDVECIRVRNS